ncbi:uncharacterized protein OCT59_014607 [Rhizophagus irregularis]|uniref:uncharacterized protein n=1 Tax=Rhizophagus irregularis TaxID=588596 RepID=UPI00332778E4|nr:hypothetical protein OCT59_014607 [Rhizophagus irregularis]
MNERFILSLPILRMEGVENTGSQPVKGYLRCAKYFGDLSSWPPPLFPICPSTDMELEEEMEIDNDDMVTDAQESSTTQKKCTRKSTTEKSFSKKKKTTNKDDVSTMLKKLIKELLTNIPDTGKILEEMNVSDASSNTRTPSRMNFLCLSNMIEQAEKKMKMQRGMSSIDILPLNKLYICDTRS